MSKYYFRISATGTQNPEIPVSRPAGIQGVVSNEYFDFRVKYLAL